MYLLLPMDNNDPKIAKLTKINDAKYWAQILIDDGKLADIKFEIDKDNFNNFSEAVVVENDHEYVWPFMEENIAVLVAPYQETLDEVIEAFIFKELHDLNIA